MLRLSLIKVYPVKGDLNTNSGLLREALAAIVPAAPDVVITPECFLDGYVVTEKHVTAEDMKDYAVDPATSPYVAEVAQWAAEHRAWVILGCTRLAPDGLYNSALILNRQGQLAGIYDKLHCRGPDEKVCKGQSLRVFEGDFGTFGVMICADRRRPEVARTLALAGARIVFNPTYGACNEMNAQVIRVRAFENELFIAQAHPNQALITGPDGDIVLDQTVNSTPHGTATVDLERVDQKRQSRKSLLKDRRPELYRLG